MPPLPTPTITGDADALLIIARRDAALSKEQQAWVDQVTTRQWELMAEHYKTLQPGAEGEKNQARVRADRARVEADEMHALAGTDTIIFKSLIVNALLSTKASWEGQYVRAIDAQQNPKAYGNDRTPPELWICGLAAVDEFLKIAEEL